MTHIDLSHLPPGGPEIWGPLFWDEFHEILQKIPCSECQPEAVSRGRAFHDVKNVELGKPVQFPKDLVRFQKAINAAVKQCHALGQCSGRRHSKFESCVRQLKHEPGVNPYAVCKASVSR
jgi:hypothetical protein